MNNTTPHYLQHYIEELLEPQIVIMGLGKEGLSTYAFVRAHLPEKEIWLIDEKDVGQLSPEWKHIQETDSNVLFLTKTLQEELQESPTAKNQAITVFKTPGIPPKNPLITWAQHFKAHFTSNTDLFFALIELVNHNLPETTAKIKTIGITGTKGKSTTSALIHHILQGAQLHSFLGGNIGIAPLSLFSQVLETATTNATHQPVCVVLELSCHQLSDITHSPHYAVVLDITQEHLDYYETFESYVQAKTHLCLFQTKDDFVVYNPELYLPKKVAHLSNATHLHFNLQRNTTDNWLCYNQEKIVDLDTLPLIGDHTIANALPGVVIAKHLGIASTTIANSLQTFKSLAHRLELIASINGVSYYNDSLSTTPVATIAALESFKNTPLILIAGGFNRGLDYGNLAQSILDHQVKHLVLLPDTGEIILQEIQKRITNSMGELNFTFAAGMQQAVTIAKKYAQPGDIVLMSPASASFNLFKDYQDRGEQFAKYAQLR